MKKVGKEVPRRTAIGNCFLLSRCLLFVSPLDPWIIRISVWFTIFIFHFYPCLVKRREKSVQFQFVDDCSWKKSINFLVKKILLKLMEKFRLLLFFLMKVRTHNLGWLISEISLLTTWSRQAPWEDKLWACDPTSGSVRRIFLRIEKASFYSLFSNFFAFHEFEI